MGNCIVIHEKPVRVMRTDGKIIEYKAPIRVEEVLSEYYHHVISDGIPVLQHMHPLAEMRRGHLYYLLPLPAAKKTIKKKKAVRFSDDVIALEEAKQTAGVVRVKVVISKRELLEMLGKERDSAEDTVSQMQKETS
ncbi:uncharacterized protein LOC127250925 [Andrographis paniculata]|uniref:uncharacterized protein LOC127250925 n=1 Tax=Andrographis paniculata TaxID=175694 RepID=UPI0021E72211|nr:uncharacterized protein LOC127250925 [Andrographis paniculata]